ncbi:MAG: metallophosphoesterase [Lachnospiraceae bacterium]|nr:metallophosphoesterase [Lachnospiraceae bacterium]
MIVLFALTIAGVCYLANRIGKFALIQKLTRGKKVARMLAGLLIAAALTAVIWLAWGSMNAIVCVLHLIIFWLVSDGIFALIKKRRKKPFTRYYAGIAAITFTICYLGVGWYQAHHVWQTAYQIQTDKNVGDLRVAVFSDSHTGTTFHGDGFAEHMKEIEAQNPDLVLIVGDFVDDDTSKEDMIRCCEALGEMKTTYGVYFVFGNHDKGYYSPDYRGYDGDDLIAELEKNNVHVMQDDVELIDDRFYLIGRTDKSEEYASGRKTMEELTADLDPDKFSIVLDHQPEDYDAQAKADVDLVLSGHTHGGQLFPLRPIEELTNMTPDDRIYGYEKRGNTNFIVTSGISDWAIKFKTGCRSEYLMLEISGNSKS